MAIVEMKKVYLLGHQAQKEDTLDILQKMAVVEVNDLQAGEMSAEDWIELVERDQEQERLQELESRLAEVRFVLDFLNRHHPEKKKLLDALGGGKIPVTEARMSSGSGVWEKETSEVYSELRAVEEQLMGLRNEETRLQNLKTLLAPWDNLDAPLEEIRVSAHSVMELVILPAAELDSFRREVESAVKESILEMAHVDTRDCYLFLAYPAGKETELREAAKQFSFNRQVFPPLYGTPGENLARIEEEREALAARRRELVDASGKFTGFREELSCYYDYLTIERDKKQVVSSLARTGRSFLLEGWIKEKDLPDLEKKLSASCDTVTVMAGEPDPHERVPVALENKPAVSPFEFITRLYGLPHERGIDPTFALTPFFIAFFGICMSDAGYGLIIAAIVGTFLWKVKMSASARHFFVIMLYCGISTMFFGALIGTWFGGLIPLEPLFFNATKEPITMLLYCLGIGVFHIFVGLGIAFYRNVRDGKTLDGIFDQLFWMLFIGGLLLFAIPGMDDPAKIIAAAAGAGLILTQGRAKKGVVMKFGSGIFSLYGITGYLGDVLSYSRLLALGLATSVIGMAINTIAGLFAGSVPGAVLMTIIYIAGHTFNLVINLLGAFVHTIRLQYLEFFSRFYESGGRPFKPFAVNTSYVEITSPMEIPSEPGAAGFKTVS